MNQETMLTILFVDDEISILEIAREYFSHKGYRVITAQNGREAVAILEQEDIDCCFTDINMPEMDGIQLAEHIYRTDNTIPVVIMTGFPSLEDTIHLLKNGVVDFLIKPVELSQMEICVRRVMRERELFVENLILQEELESKQRIERLNQELLAKVKELRTINKIMQDFTVISSSADIFKQLAETTVEVVQADWAAFFVINEGLQAPVMVSHSIGGTVAEADNERFKAQLADPEHYRWGSIVMESVNDNLPLLISKNSGARGLDAMVRSFMVAPMTIRTKSFGVLCAGVLDGQKRFDEKDLYYLSFMTQIAASTIENLALYENIYQNLFSTLYAFVAALEARDPYTHLHSSRVTAIAVELGRRLGCSSEEVDILSVAGQLHDVGKIGIPDDILLKPGQLTDAEFEKIKEHPAIGAGIIDRVGFWEREKQIVHCHHERYDGGGYPDGLAGDDIPFLARILSVADAYDAMASDRAYRKRMPEAKVLSIIDECTGSQFDPDVVRIFMELHQEGHITAIDTSHPSGQLATHSTSLV